MNQEHKDKLTAYRELIEKELESALAGEFRVEQAMRYSTLGGGKRIRGILTLEFCRVFGGKIESAVPVAAALEMVQAFSLVHDDLPCMDDDDERRGKPSCHKQFDEATALLAGGALFANALNSVAATAFVPDSIKAKHTVAIISTLSSAVMEMIRGQQLDIQFEASEKKLTEDDIINMYNRKTGALISAACVCGAICAGASDKNLHKARGYGVALGLAFQLADDLLDFAKEKPGKKTYATEFGEKRTKEKAWEYTESAVKIAGSISDGAFLKELVIMLCERKA
ncbi:MAG: polyprenyl synthetase family protein [Oscillospiraceae bacterium]|nr:polyprenyl synthetase family protein [Oscillospiraceae bacterium]